MDWSKAQALAVKTEHGLELRKLGQLAAGRYLSDGMDPTEAVRSIAEKTNLNAEEIRRTCEFANNEILLKKMADGERKITFPLAKAAEVLKTQEPQAPPITEKLAAYVPDAKPRWQRKLDMPMDKLANFMGPGAAPPPPGPAGPAPGMPPGPPMPPPGGGMPTFTPPGSPVQPDAMINPQIQYSLKRAVEEAGSKFDAMVGQYQQALAMLREEVRSLILEGTPMQPMGAVMKQAGLPETILLESAATLPPYTRIVPTSDEELEINQDHPFMKKVATVLRACSEAKKALDVHTVLKDHLTMVERASGR